MLGNENRRVKMKTEIRSGSIPHRKEIEPIARILRRICKQKLSRAFDSIQHHDKISILPINLIQTAKIRTLQQAFIDIKASAYPQSRIRLDKNDLVSSSFAIVLSLLLRQKKRESFNKILSHAKKQQSRISVLVNSLKQLEMLKNKALINSGFAKLKQKLCGDTCIREGIQKFQALFSDKHKKNIEYAYQHLLKYLYHQNYQRLFKLSDEKRRTFNNMENKRNSQFSKEKLELYKLQSQVGSKNQEKNIKLGEMKRQLNIKMNRAKDSLRGEGAMVEQKNEQRARLENALQMSLSNTENRKKLSEASVGAYQRTCQLYKEITNKKQESIRTMSEQLERLKKNKLEELSEFFIYRGIEKRQLISLYENVPTLHLSNEYCRAREENQNLKEYVCSLIEVGLVISNQTLKNKTNFVQQKLDQLTQINQSYSGQSVSQSQKNSHKKSSQKSTIGRSSISRY